MYEYASIPAQIVLNVWESQATLFCKTEEAPETLNLENGQKCSVTD